MPKHPKVAISGSRTFTYQPVIALTIERLIERRARILIPCGDSGCTRGADTYSHSYVKLRSDAIWQQKVYYARWQRFGKRAGFLRNEEMIKDAGELIAFLGPGPSPGTHHAIELAQRRGIVMHVYVQGSGWVSLTERL